METIYNQVRYWDYHIFLIFHDAIAGREWLNGTYLFFAKYGIVFFFLAFIYLIYRVRIAAFFTSFIAMAIAGATDLLIAFFWQRPRPFISHASDVMTPITAGLRVDSISFPSAHTYICFAIATSVFLYGHKRLGSALFLLAIAVGIGRIGAGLHYPSDVIAGAMLGIASGILAYLIMQNREKVWHENSRNP